MNNEVLPEKVLTFSIKKAHYQEQAFYHIFHIMLSTRLH